VEKRSADQFNQSSLRDDVVIASFCKCIWLNCYFVYIVTSSWQDRDKFVTSLWLGHGCSSLVCVWLSTNGCFLWR